MRPRNAANGQRRSLLTEGQEASRLTYSSRPFLLRLVPDVEFFLAKKKVSKSKNGKEKESDELDQVAGNAEDEIGVVSQLFVRRSSLWPEFAARHLQSHDRSYMQQSS